MQPQEFPELPEAEAQKLQKELNAAFDRGEHLRRERGKNNSEHAPTKPHEGKKVKENMEDERTKLRALCRQALKTLIPAIDEGIFEDRMVDEMPAWLNVLIEQTITDGVSHEGSLDYNAKYVNGKTPESEREAFKAMRALIVELLEYNVLYKGVPAEEVSTLLNDKLRELDGGNEKKIAAYFSTRECRIYAGSVVV